MECVTHMSEPVLIQGGMGVGVSGWTLARAVSRAGQLGVVSGTALAHVFSRRLQLGDVGGHLREALKHFPVPQVAQKVLEKYLRVDPPANGDGFKAVTMYRQDSPEELLQLTVVANFCEVHLAKKGHGGRVGLNLLEKVQLPNLASIYGAMLAGVDYVLMGAGIPREIPGVLDKLARHEPVQIRLQVTGEVNGGEHHLRFDPAKLLGGDLPPLMRPRMLAIVASTVLAMSLSRGPGGGVDGFVVEGPTAGGHNAPPRGALNLDAAGQPVYGPRDEVDLDVVLKLGKPFWLAGSYAHPDRVREALSRGATGVQVGTAFALCEESGLEPSIKLDLARKVLDGTAEVYTSAVASPTGYPFKVVTLEGTMSDPEVYAERTRVCDIGLLRSAYAKPDGSLGFRCPAEPVRNYLMRGGHESETVGRNCLCNGLLASIGLGQRRKSGVVEPPILTAGDDLVNMGRFYKDGRLTYTAQDVIDDLLGGLT
jgi:nitronate monooxygenase